MNNLKDQCGVCGGNGEECVDCAGVVNGKKQLDVCGECLELDDPNFNTGRLPFLIQTSVSVSEYTHADKLSQVHWLIYALINGPSVI